MANTNHIKAPAANATSVRGIGKLGYTEGGRLNSTIKKIQASMDGDEFRPVPSRKKTIVCPGCGRRFKANKIPAHKPRSWHFMSNNTDGDCPQTKNRFRGFDVIDKKIHTTVINDIEVNKGDTIAFIAMPWAYPNHATNELKEYKVLDVCLMGNGSVALDLGIEDEFGETWYINVARFTKNFIKL